MKTLTFGDIHGRDCWKTIIFGGDLNFQKWCDAPSDLEYDKVIFIGDYVDSFDFIGPEIFLNLKDILKLKLTAPDKVVLLFGNHDWQYIANKMYSGFDLGMAFDYRTFFLDNLRHFDLAYYQKVGERDVIWTHAGITNRWLNEYLMFFEDKLAKFDLLVTEENVKNPQFVVDCLNFALQTVCPKLNDVGYESGGDHPTGGPIWTRIAPLYRDALPNVTQIVGHTKVAKMIHFNANDDATILMVDCLNFANTENTINDCLVIDGGLPDTTEAPTRLIFNR